MVDIHCHIIPAIDDGVQTMEESLELIRLEVAAGTTAFVATPHIYTDAELRMSAQIGERLEQVRQAAHEAGIQVDLYPGAEVYPFMGVVKGIDEGFPITAGGHGKHMLIDLPMSNLPMDFGTLLFEIQARGITPIIAHPERNGSFQNEPELLEEYLDRGILAQVNAGSLRGKYGERAKEMAMYYLERQWPSFLGSDAHKPSERSTLGKSSLLVADVLDPDYLHTITHLSGAAIAAGQPVPDIKRIRPATKKAAKQGWLSRFTSR